MRHPFPAALLTALWVCRIAFGEPTGASFSLDELEAALKVDPTNKPLILEIARLYHRKLLTSGDQKVWSQAKQHFRVLYDQFDLGSFEKKGKKVDAVALALHASYRSLLGHRSKANTRFHHFYAKTVLAGQGTGDLDTVVNLYPNNLEVRYIRALNAYYTPAAGRMKVMLGDFQYIMRACAKDSELAKQFDLPELCLMGGKAAYLSQEFIQAEFFLAALCATYPESPEAKEAQDLLTTVEPLAKGQRESILRASGTTNEEQGSKP